MKLPDWLANHEYGAELHAMLAVAWADGVLADSERDFLRELVRRAGARPTETQLVQWFENPPDADEAARNLVDPVKKIFVIKQAIMLSAADGHYAAPERRLLRAWSKAWRIDAATLAWLEAEVARETEIGG